MQSEAGRTLTVATQPKTRENGVNRFLNFQKFPTWRTTRNAWQILQNHPVMRQRLSYYTYNHRVVQSTTIRYISLVLQPGG